MIRSVRVAMEVTIWRVLTLNDGEFVVKNLGEGSKAVGGAGGVGDDGLGRIVLVQVDTCFQWNIQYQLLDQQVQSNGLFTYRKRT